MLNLLVHHVTGRLSKVKELVPLTIRKQITAVLREVSWLKYRTALYMVV